MEDNAERAYGAANAFNKLWIDFATEMAQTGLSFSPDRKAPDMAKSVRNVFFKAMSQYCDQMMRSPEFLDSMKESMKHSLAFKKQMNDLFGRFHHETQGVSRQDLDQLMLALRHVESRVIDGVDRIGESLEKACERIDKLEELSAAPVAKKKAAPVRRSPAKKASTAKRKKKKKTTRRR